MTICERVIAVLQEAEGPLCDDHVKERAGLKWRQLAYKACSKLARDKKANRWQEAEACVDCRREKIHREKYVTTWREGGRYASLEKRTKLETRSWYWEGNVQQHIADWLAAQGYEIVSQADTVSRKQGPDIVARKNEDEMWVSVKGYPEGKDPTQARHYFADAVLGLLLDHHKRPDVTLALGFPRIGRTYTGLAGRVRWLRERFPFTIYWVHKSGEVEMG